MKKNILLDCLSTGSRGQAQGNAVIIHRGCTLEKVYAMLSIFVLCQCLLVSQPKEKNMLDAWNIIHEIDNANGAGEKGELSKREKFIESKLQGKTELSTNEIEILQQYLVDIKAIRREYTLSYAEVYQELKTKIPDLSARDMRKWENDYSLEYYLIDGKKKYYSNCIFDLFQVNKEAARRAKIPEDKAYDASIYPWETISSFEKGMELSKKINISFTFTEEVGVLPNNTLIKAWIPYVRENKYQSNIKIVRSSVDNITLPKKDNLTSMIYFEIKIDLKNNSNAEWRAYFKEPSPSWIGRMSNQSPLKDTNYVCQFVYRYDSKGYYKNVNPRDIQPYHTSNKDYQKYTKETESNLFTPYLINLSKEIVGEETNDYLKAKKIYEWICKNVIWTDPKPVLGDKAEYTAKYKRGDCGLKSNLFISLCRINEIPARSQGGWRVQPDGDHAQHTWAQAYFEPYGWLSVDVTVGAHLIDHQDERARYFYFGNCTPYHLIIYDDETELLPEKDFACIYGGGPQLGAFEWKSGDIEPNIKIDSYVE
ncbi:MAG: transglutaminase domain-containing protein [Thermodesulfovibrionales bacterium]|nr:transglutaminase domain-containing protein [Thermodesulfovibrionales bacterium]